MNPNQNHNAAQKCEMNDFQLTESIQGNNILEDALKESEEQFRENEKKYRQLFDNMENGFIYLKVIFDDKQNPIDCIVLEVNNAYELQTGILRENIIGNRGKEILQKYEYSQFEWIQLYGKVALTGKATKFEVYTNRWYSGIAYSPQKYYTAVLFEDISERKAVERKLKQIQLELRLKTEDLEETNTALKVLLKHQDEELLQYQQSIVSSIQTLILPYLEKLKKLTTNEKQKNYLNIIDLNLTSMLQSFDLKISEIDSKLSPTENQIVNLILANKNTCEILEILNISESTLFSYRKSIRSKLGIKNTKTNLKSYLQSLLHK